MVMKMQEDYKKRIFIFIIFVYILNSASFLLAKQGPRIQFNEESKHFGSVKQGKVLTHVFVFQNVGDSLLTIKNVRTTCGCTAAIISAKKIDPGKKGELNVSFNTTGFGGSLSKYILVESNDPDSPRKQLTVAADIDIPPRPKIELDQYSADVGLILENEGIQTKAKIRNTGERELLVNLTHKDASFFQNGKKVTSPIKITSGKESEIEIKIPTRSRMKTLREYVLMRSNDPMRPNLSLYLSGYVVSKEQLKDLFEKYKDELNIK